MCICIYIPNNTEQWMYLNNIICPLYIVLFTTTSSMKWLKFQTNTVRKVSMCLFPYKQQPNKPWCMVLMQCLYPIIWHSTAEVNILMQHFYSVILLLSLLALVSPVRVFILVMEYICRYKILKPCGAAFTAQTETRHTDLSQSLTSDIPRSAHTVVLMDAAHL